MRPSLFHYATKELSQDAFLCWLVAHLEYEAEPALQEAARGFVALLYGKAHPETNLAGARIRLVPGSLRPQYKRIDVYFQAEIDGRVVSFLIEDKVDSSEHGDQTTRYLDRVRGDDLAEDEVVAIYLKTGYLFDADHAVAAKGYHLLDYQEFHDFLCGYATDNAIFVDYRDNLGRRCEHFRSRLAALFEPGGHAQFAHDFCQFEFFKQLDARCPESHPDPFPDLRLHRDRNIGGSPWTQLHFVDVPGALPGGHGDRLFYRVDGKINRDHPEGRQWGYYLALRYYSRIRPHAEARAAKPKRLAMYRACFDRAVTEAGGALKFTNPAADHQGADESEVALLFFDDGDNSLSRVLEQLPLIHKAFVARVQAVLAGPSAE